MFDGKISRRTMLEIIFGGSVSIILGILGPFRFANSASSVAQLNSTNGNASLPLLQSNNSSDIRYGVARVLVEQVGPTYRAVSSDGSLISSGTNPTKVINEALSQGLTPGRTYKETVKLKGRFTNLGSIVLPSYVELDLSDSYLRQSDSIKNHLLTNSNKAVGSKPNTSIGIFGGIIDGNKTGNSADVVDRDFPGDDVSNTIHFENMRDCNIDRITLINGYYHGLRIRNSVNVSINNSTFNSVSRESISISGLARPSGTCKQIRVSNNTISNSGNSAISTLKASDVLISKNICDTIIGEASGITINGLNNMVVDNIVRNSHDALISIAQLDSRDYDASGSIVSGNICQGARISNGVTLLGYGCKNIVITNNRISDTSEGISISASNQNILVNNNSVSACRNSGIRVSGVKGFLVQYIRISGNMCFNNGAARGASELNKSGIRLSADEHGLLQNCVIESNSCFDDRQSQRTQDFGIRLVKTKDCIIRLNYLKNNIIAGISAVDNIGLVSGENVGQN